MSPIEVVEGSWRLVVVVLEVSEDLAPSLSAGHLGDGSVCVCIFVFGRRKRGCPGGLS